MKERLSHISKFLCTQLECEIVRINCKRSSNRTDDSTTFAASRIDILIAVRISVLHESVHAIYQGQTQFINIVGSLRAPELNGNNASKSSTGFGFWQFGEQPAAPSKREGSDRILGQLRVDGEAGILDIADELRLGPADLVSSSSLRSLICHSIRYSASMRRTAS